MLIPSGGSLQVSNAEKRLAYSAWFTEQCLRYLFMNRAMTMKIVADGRTKFNNGYHRLMVGLLFSEAMCDGFWEALKHMLYEDQINGQPVKVGKPWSDAQAKMMAFAELDTYHRTSKERHTYDEWHEKLNRDVSREMVH